MSRARCSKCNKNKSTHLFSKTQLNKPKKQRKCKSCVSKQQKQQAKNPPKKANDVDKNAYIQSLYKDAEKLEEPGQLSFLQKLHRHCLNKTVFTEIHLGIKINPNSPMCAQAGLEKIFKLFPDTFVYHNKVIIASTDQKFQASIYLGIKNNLGNAIKLIHQNTRFCCGQLSYKNGKISSKGVELYDSSNTIENSDISSFLSDPTKNEIFDEKETDEAHLFEQARLQSVKLMTLQQDQQTLIAKINKLKKQLNDKQNKMKIIMNSNPIITWNSIKAQLEKKPDDIFNQEHLQIFKDLLATVLMSDNVTVEDCEGPLSDLTFQIKEKTISITGNLKNKEFLNNLEDVINYFGQQIEIQWNEHDKQREEKSEQKEDTDDSMQKLVNTLKRDIAQHDVIIKCCQKSFAECSTQISKIVHNSVAQLQLSRKSDSELWNVEMPPTKLILDISVKPEPFFIEYVMQKKQMVLKWISNCIHKYEGIYEYGVDHIWTRFINFVMDSHIDWWIAVLRWLSFPVSISNLNLLRKWVRKSVDEHFMPNRSQFGSQVDVMMVVTYFMNAMPNRYRANPLKFVYDDKRNVTLNIGDNVRESETQIIKLCDACVRYVISILPKYKQSSNQQKMNRKIDIYMSKLSC